jgi:hypothetical protein
MLVLDRYLTEVKNNNQVPENEYTTKQTYVKHRYERCQHT